MDRASAGLRRRYTAEEATLRDPIAASPSQVPRPQRKRRGFAVSKINKPSKASSSSTSIASFAAEQNQGGKKRNLNCMLDDNLQDLALPLGTSFAALLSEGTCGREAGGWRKHNKVRSAVRWLLVWEAEALEPTQWWVTYMGVCIVVAAGGGTVEARSLSCFYTFGLGSQQVLCGKSVPMDQLPAEKLSMICTSAVKAALSTIHGDRFDSFMKNFERSFDSTLKTLLVFNKVSGYSKKYRLRDDRTLNLGDKLIEESYNDEKGNISFSSFGRSPCDIERIALSSEEQLGEDEALSSTNQLTLCGESNRGLVALSSTNQFALSIESNQELVQASHNLIAPDFSKSMLTAFEKSNTERTRSNDLKEIEIGLTMRKLQIKQSQLTMSSHANWLENVKICMNMSKAAFKEEKLRNQIEDSRHTELRRRCLDLLVSGLILMCAFLIYGASIFSYQRITEATSSCAAMSRESKSWWMPKQMASFSSGWQMLRCQTLVITRMLFGLLMILVVAYCLLQRSAVSGSTMPVTSILLLLGVACGIAGKLCVDSLGGSGYHWVICWEALCLVHLFANIFPSILYRALYGRVLAAEAKTMLQLPYWIRRYAFYVMLLLVLPTMAGLLPFASLLDWKDHFAEKMNDFDFKGWHKG